MKELQDLVNHIMVQEVSKELQETIDETGLPINDQDGTPTIFVDGLHKVAVPKTMNKLQASHNLLKQFKEEETLRSYNRSYSYIFLNDFMVAINAMITKYFGMLHVSKVNTDGKKAGTDYIQIATGYDAKDNLVTQQGYVGSIIAPCWDDAILDISPMGIVVRAKLKFEKDVNNFLNEVDTYVKKHSVIKGISVTVSETRGGLLATPINPKENKKIILDESVERIIGNLIIPSLADTSKTSLLFTGDFGTGKTETAIRVGVAAQKAYNRTFFYLHNADLFAALIPYLKNYQPAVVFVEDVDQISAGDRDTMMNNLLNQLDGNELKNVNCTFIFTTNNHDKIHPAMRRPGRIDQVVHFDYCTAEMIAKIFKVYVEDMVGSDQVDYVAAAEAAIKVSAQLQGAVVAEISRRARKYADKLHDGFVSTEVFLDAIASMEHHIKFMREDQKKDNSAEELLGHLLHKGLTKALPGLEGVSESYGDPSPYKGLI